jgi:hypothetical protein
MNLHKYFFTWDRIVIFILSLFKDYFALKSYYRYKRNINYNNLNLISFTSSTFNITDFKTILLNFNDKNNIRKYNFFSFSPNFIYIFNSEGTLIGYCVFLFHKPYNQSAEVSFDTFVFSIWKDIFISCDLEMRDNIKTINDKFYICICNKDLISRYLKFF